jgi:hypothetical protein
MLTLGHVEEMLNEEIRFHLTENYLVDDQYLDQFEILIAYETFTEAEEMEELSSASFFLLKDRFGKFFEVETSQDEGFILEEISFAYLVSPHYNLERFGENQEEVRMYLDHMKKRDWMKYMSKLSNRKW